MFRFSKLKELVERELNVQSAVILDDRGIDISVMHADEILALS